MSLAALLEIGTSANATRTWLRMEGAGTRMLPSPSVIFHSLVSRKPIDWQN
jgi:hypothetical protein